MKVLIITEVDLESGQYEVTFRNKSEPGMPMDLTLIKNAWKKVAEDFLGESPKEAGPKQVLS